MTDATFPAEPLYGERNFRQWLECSRKRPFRSRKLAMDHAKGLRKIYGNKMGAYQCERCGSWHLFTERGKRSGKG